MASSTRTACRSSPMRRSTSAITSSRKRPGPRAPAGEAAALPDFPSLRRGAGPTSILPTASTTRRSFRPSRKSMQLDPALLHAVITVESGYNPKARSPKGAIGLMQLMPDTARRYAVANIWDPRDNLQRRGALPARPAGAVQQQPRPRARRLQRGRRRRDAVRQQDTAVRGNGRLRATRSSAIPLDGTAPAHDRRDT